MKESQRTGITQLSFSVRLSGGGLAAQHALLNPHGEERALARVSNHAGQGEARWNFWGMLGRFAPCNADEASGKTA
jgi:hypothetical protein